MKSFLILIAMIIVSSVANASDIQCQGLVTRNRNITGNFFATEWSTDNHVTLFQARYEDLEISAEVSAKSTFFSISGGVKSRGIHAIFLSDFRLNQNTGAQEASFEFPLIDGSLLKFICSK